VYCFVLHLSYPCISFNRLDRLFLLLDTGSSSITRKAAAQQLGEVQRLHPHKLPLLIRKVYTFLKSPSWDTRIAASQAINAIISHVPQWKPVPQLVKSEDGISDDKTNVGRLGFDTFNVQKVLANRHYLMASEGKELDADETPVGDPKERLLAQRQTLNQKLGLDLAAKLGIDTGDIVSAEDLEVQKQPKIEPDENTNNHHITVPVAEAVSEEMKQLSSREANRAKRKARQGAKQKSRDLSREGSPSSDQPNGKRRKKEKEDAALVVVDSVPDPAGTWPDSAQYWPFESFCDLLVSSLFSPSWEVS